MTSANRTRGLRARRRRARRAQTLQPAGAKDGERRPHADRHPGDERPARAATTNTRTSIDASAMPGMPAGAIATNVSQERERQQAARRRPPRATSSRLSASARRASRTLPAPTAARTANSRWRSATRASIRLVTFTQAISRKTADGADEQPGDARGVADPPVAQRLARARRHATRRWPVA